MKKVLIKVYVFPVTKSKIKKIAVQNKKSQNNLSYLLCLTVSN